MGPRDKLRRLEKAARSEVDYLQLRSGVRYYFDPDEVGMVFFLEDMDKGFRDDPDAHTPEIRQALSRATPESRARFEERFGPSVREHGLVHSEEHITVRRICVDGSVETFTVEGEAARERLRAYREQGARSWA